LTLAVVSISSLTKKSLLVLPIFSSAGFYLIMTANADFKDPGHISTFAPSRGTTVHGKVATGFKYYGGGYRFNMEVAGVEIDGVKNPAHGLLQVSVYNGENPPLPGDYLQLTNLRLKPVTPYRNFGGFDYKKYLEDKGIGLRAGVRSEKQISAFEAGSPANPHRFGESLRRKGMAYIKRNFPEKSAPIARSMTFGVTGELSQDVRRNFQQSGLAHLLAISGLHVGFITAFSWFFFYLILFTLAGRINRLLLLGGHIRRPTAVLAILTALIFVLSTGIKVSAMRAGIMVAVYLLSVAIGRDREVLNAISLSAILILLFDPAALFSPSFLMSYIAVLAIFFMILPEIEKEDDPLSKIGTRSATDKLTEYLLVTVKISVAVSLAVAPVVLAFFSKVYFGGFVANIVAIPLAAVAIPATLIAALVDGISTTLGTLAAWPGIIAFGGIEYVSKLFSGLNPLSISGPPLPLPMLALYYTVVCLWFFKSKHRLWTTPLLVLSLLLFFINWPRSGDTVRFFDVGQGDSALIMLKSGENILVDGGIKFGRADAGEFVIVPALLRLKVRELDAVIATHGDKDHAGGLKTVLKRIPVKRYFDNAQPDNTNYLDRLRETADRLGIPTGTLRSGMVVDGSGGKLRTLHPDNGFVDGKLSRIDNDYSITMMLDLGGKRILLPGDLEKIGEQYLIENSVDIDADVLKVAHHGSATSSRASFLNKVTPKLAVITAGKYNRWKFPAKSVLDRFEKKGIEVLSTKDDGEIVITVKDKKMFVKTFANRGEREIK
jgi:competence protein ComEC